MWCTVRILWTCTRALLEYITRVCLKKLSNCMVTYACWTPLQHVSSHMCCVHINHTIERSLLFLLTLFKSSIAQLAWCETASAEPHITDLSDFVRLMVISMYILLQPSLTSLFSEWLASSTVIYQLGRSAILQQQKCYIPMLRRGTVSVVKALIATLVLYCLYVSPLLVPP